MQHTSHGALEVRDLHFDVDRDVPRFWHGGRRSVTTFFDNLSIMFPAGERFFIASVKRFRHRVKEGTPLDADVRGFCAQEGVHSREHQRYNDRLRAQGYPVDELEREVKALLAGGRTMPARWQLAVTCALEHFTALMGHFILEDPRLLEGADAKMAALWRWHAFEENEHKSVAYDVYLASGGNAVERSVVMLVASAIFWAKVLQQQARMMRVDGTLWSVREWAALGKFLFVKPGGMGRLFFLWLRYFAPSFHPRDIDSTHLIANFERELA